MWSFSVDYTRFITAHKLWVNDNPSGFTVCIANKKIFDVKVDINIGKC